MSTDTCAFLCVDVIDFNPLKLNLGVYKRCFFSMKKYLLSFLPFLMMAMCVSFLSSCSDDDDDESGQSIVGTWVEDLTSGTSGIVTTFTFKSDGSGVMLERVYVDNQALTTELKFSYTYNASTGVIRLKFDNDGTLYSGDVSITGKTLVLRYDGTYYSLTKQ